MSTKPSETEELTQKLKALTVDDSSVVVKTLDFSIETESPVQNPLLAMQGKSKCFIFNPPVNSSGDIYHVAAYMLLCQHFNWALPDKIYLAYDCPGVKKQAERSQAFLKILNFSNSELLDVKEKLLPGKTPSYRSPSRLKKTKSCINVKNEVDNYISIEQKMTTALLESACKKYGHKKIKGILKTGFLTRPWKRIGKINSESLNDWITEKIKVAKLKIGKKPFIVFHDRFSDKANGEQTIDNEKLKKLKELTPAHVELLTISVGGKGTTAKIQAFENIEKCDGKYDKFRHIQLMHALSVLPNFLGLIGGTSGTLDVCAFMGIKTFNIHQFALKKKNDLAISPQDFRILLQTPFMSVASANNFQDKINPWLQGKETAFPLYDFERSFKKENTEGRRSFGVSSKGKEVNKQYFFQNARVEGLVMIGKAIAIEKNKKKTEKINQQASEGSILVKKGNVRAKSFEI